MRQARDAEIANDLFQEVWSRVIANRARYEPRAKFRTFLFTLAHNCFIDHCRRVKVAARRASGIDDADAADLLPADEDRRCPDAELERDEASRRYRAALATLPPEQRDVYLLHEESELSLEEIARVTGVGAETAKSRLRYAVGKLKAALASRKTWHEWRATTNSTTSCRAANRCSAGRARTCSSRRRKSTASCCARRARPSRPRASLQRDPQRLAGACPWRSPRRCWWCSP